MPPSNKILAIPPNEPQDTVFQFEETRTTKGCESDQVGGQLWPFRNRAKIVIVSISREFLLTVTVEELQS